VTDTTEAVQPFQQKPDNVAYEPYLYAPGDGPTPQSSHVEEWLAQVVDGPAAAPLAKYIRTGQADNRERSILARFFAVQDMRTPRARDVIVPLFQKELGAEWERWRADPDSVAKDMEVRTGVRPETPDVAAFLESHELVANKGTWLDFIQRMMNRAGRRVFASTWWLGYAPPDGQFVTSDVGIAKASDRPLNFVSWRMGFLEGRNVWAIPLSSAVVLVITTERGTGAASEVSPEYMDALNQHIRNDAIRCVYSRNRLS
jgi:hypothetical protein